MPVEEVCRIFPDYRTCLALDQELLNGNSCFIMSNETVETENGTSFFHTYRQKLTHFGQDFVICSVYKDENRISVDKLTGCFNKEYRERSPENGFKQALEIADKNMYQQKSERKQIV